MTRVHNVWWHHASNWVIEDITNQTRLALIGHVRASKRGFLSNVPVAASEGDLQKTTLEQGKTIIKIHSRKYKKTTIKIYGWTICATMDTTQFDGEEFAIIWGGKTPQTTTTTATEKTVKIKESLSKTKRNCRNQTPIQMYSELKFWLIIVWRGFNGGRDI